MYTCFRCLSVLHSTSRPCLPAATADFALCKLRVSLELIGDQFVVKRFSNRYFYSFSLILVKLRTHDLCANTQKNCGTDLEILIIKFFCGIF